MASKCVICKQSCDEIKCFNENTLKKCQEVLEYRKSKTYKRKSKYVDVNLPENENNKSEGYHVSCYSNFTAVTLPRTNDENSNNQSLNIVSQQIQINNLVN